MSISEEAVGSARPPSTGAVQFSGDRGDLFGMLIGGYLLMLPTLGLYRFWLTTAKRRFYWQNTLIGGDRLEYTGSPLQLLTGFLFALGVFLPIYLVFFYLSFQSSTIAGIGYGAAALLLWFLSGYAIYRGRDFRLSRTLWRGVRFDQKGSAMGYAVRRFGWSILVVATAGLALPFMAASLWRYRYRNTWFGDRQFAFTGSWKTVAGPFYRAWGVLAFTVAVAFGVVASSHGAAAGIFWAIMLVLGVGMLCFIYYRSREATRMFSQVRLGPAGLSVRVRARALFGQYLVFGLLLVLALVLVGMVGMALTSTLNADFRPGDFSPATVARAGWLGLALGAGGYLVGLSTFTLLGEVVIDCGYWLLVSRGATITNLESLGDVAAIPEDKSVAGEGLADALNVGSF